MSDRDVVRVGTNADGSTFLWFTCPGCKENHGVTVNGPAGVHPNWHWNESTIAPTLSPSLLVRFSRMSAEGWRQYHAWKAGDIAAPERFDSRDEVCHSFVRDGRIEFLGDCTHPLAGQTVSLAPVDRDTIDADE